MKYNIFFPYRKRSISEVQLMHNVREHKQVGERQDWLQDKLKNIIVTSAKPKHGQSGNIKTNNDIIGSTNLYVQSNALPKRCPLQGLRAWLWNIFLLAVIVRYLLSVCTIYLFIYL